MQTEGALSLAARLTAACSVLLLAGCMATSKAWQVLKDPSLPIGLPQDQPSTLAISLLASPVANATAEAERELETEVQSSPAYRIRLSSSNLRSLLGQLRTTAETLERELDTHGEWLPILDDSSVSTTEQHVEMTDVLDATREIGEYAPAHAPGSGGGEESVGRRQGAPLQVSVLQLKDDGVFLGVAPDLLWESPSRSLGKTYLDHDEYIVVPGSYKFVPFQQVQRGTRFIAVAARYQDADTVSWRAVQRIEPEGWSYPLLVEFGESGITIRSETRE